MLNVAVIGFGTVGSGVCELLTNNADIIEKNARLFEKSIRRKRVVI